MGKDDKYGEKKLQNAHKDFVQWPLVRLDAILHLTDKNEAVTGYTYILHN